MVWVFFIFYGILLGVDRRNGGDGVKEDREKKRHFRLSKGFQTKSKIYTV